MGEEYVIYLLCFNSSEPLTAKEVRKYIRLIPHEEKKITPVLVPGCLRNVDHIRHWLTAIYFAKKDDGEGTSTSYADSGWVFPASCHICRHICWCGTEYIWCFSTANEVQPLVWHQNVLWKESNIPSHGERRSKAFHGWAGFIISSRQHTFRNDTCLLRRDLGSLQSPEESNAFWRSWTARN